MLYNCNNTEKIWKDIFEKFSLQGSFAPKIWNLKSVKQAPHSEQATGHAMHYREILFTPRCSPRAREFPGSTFLYDVRLRSYRASKLPNFWIFPNFVYFPHTKRRNVPSGDQPTAQGYIAEWLRFLHVVVEGPKGCLPAAAFSYDLGELRTP